MERDEGDPTPFPGPNRNRKGSPVSDRFSRGNNFLTTINPFSIVTLVSAHSRRASSVEGVQQREFLPKVFTVRYTFRDRRLLRRTNW